MIPELRLGVAVLTNQESGAAFESIVYQVLDHYLGAKAPDYPGALRPAGGRRAGPSSGRWTRARVGHAATRPRGRRSRWSATPAPTAMPGMATSPSRWRARGW